VPRWDGRVKPDGVQKAKSPSLIAYINLYAPARIPENFALEFFDYDWTVNHQRRRVERHESQ
jgi:hypothetical protein